MNIENKIEKFLNEKTYFTINFNTRPFENTHLKKPSGRGSWAFNFNGTLEDPEMKKHSYTPKGQKYPTYMSPSMTYIEAKKWITNAIKKELADTNKSHYITIDVEG